MNHLFRKIKYLIVQEENITCVSYISKSINPITFEHLLVTPMGGFETINQILRDNIVGKCCNIVLKFNVITKLNGYNN